MLRVDVKPELLRWARERADRTVEDLSKRFPKVSGWERGETRPTLKQLENYAKATHTPVGFFFLSEPPEDRLPIADFRSIDGARVREPSPNLLDTLNLCRRRQEWYRDFARDMGERPVAFVGSARIGDDPVSAAEEMRRLLGFDWKERRKCKDWESALTDFVDKIEAAGVLVMRSGVVLNNTRRRLDPSEFRGFALSDPLAPLIFVNGADAKAAQVFTLAHELAHIALGETGLSNAQANEIPRREVERWCNRAAAELLVPLEELRGEPIRNEALEAETVRLARRYKVSTLVVLRRLSDAGRIDRETMRQAYGQELARLRDRPPTSGGDFYRSEMTRVGKRFARALIGSTVEGRTLYRDAFQMLGISKTSTFRELASNLGAVE